MSKVTRALVIKDFYASYKSVAKAANKKPVSYSKYKKLIELMGLIYADQFLEYGIVSFPQHMGDLIIKSVPMHLIKDPLQRVYVTENKQVIRKPMTNDHSENQLKMIYWVDKDVKNKRMRIMTFSGDRTLKRSLAKNLKSGKKYPDFNKLYNI